MRDPSLYVILSHALIGKWCNNNYCRPLLLLCTLTVTYLYVLTYACWALGSGFFFLYMQHVRVIFEARTNIRHLNQLERESLLRREDALYYTFYKKLADGPDFWHGYEQLKNVTDIEYPHSVNVLQRFYVLPELVAA